MRCRHCGGETEFAYKIPDDIIIYPSAEADQEYLDREYERVLERRVRGVYYSR